MRPAGQPQGNRFVRRSVSCPHFEEGMCVCVGGGVLSDLSPDISLVLRIGLKSLWDLASLGARFAYFLSTLWEEKPAGDRGPCARGFVVPFRKGADFS